MKILLDVIAALLLITAIATAHAEMAPQFASNPAVADRLISRLIKSDATYHGLTPRGVACKVVVKKKTWGREIIVVRDADEYQARGWAIFVSLSGNVQNSPEYMVTGVSEDITRPYDDFFIKTTKENSKAANGDFDETVDSIKQSELSIGYLHEKLYSVSISHAYSHSIGRGVYETCGGLSGQLSYRSK